MLSMKRGIIKPGLLSIVAIALIALLSSVIIACTEAPTKPYNPFRLGIGYAELTGYTDGFMPGNIYEFELTIRNDTEVTCPHKGYHFIRDTWYTSLCLPGLTEYCACPPL